jgi:hypothetical protein
MYLFQKSKYLLEIISLDWEYNLDPSQLFSLEMLRVRE